MPRELRRDWRREWRAELDHHEMDGDDGRGRGRFVRGPAGWRRAVAAFPDALAVRRLARRRRAGEGHGTGASVFGAALAADLREAARTLRRAPAFSAVVVVILALGIGAVTAVFALVDGVLLSPLPYPESERIVALWERHAGGTWDRSRLTPASYFDVEARARSFEALSPIFNRSLSLTGEGDPLQVGAGMVSADYFDVLGVHPSIGRGFARRDGQPGAEPVMILAHGLWRDRFGSDPGVVGGLIEVDGEPVRVVGVMPPGAYPTFVPTSAEMPLHQGPDQAWVPLSVDEEGRRNRRSHVVGAIGRLRPDVGLEAARQELTALAASIDEVDDLTAVRLRDQVVAGARQGLLLLQGAVLLVVLLVLANVIGLLLVRGTARERALAVRSALGAGRGRLARQLVLEVVLLSLVGGLAGVGLAAVVLDTLQAPGVVELPRLSEVALDARAVAFAALLALACGLVAGGVVAARQLATLRRPGMASRPGVSAGRGTQRLRQGLVVAQVALAVTLVFGAGLLLQSFWTLTRVDPGFRSEGLVDVSLTLSSATYTQPRQLVGFYDAVRQRMEGLPGVEGVAYAYDHPLDASWVDSFRVADRPGDEGSGSAQLRIVGDGYLRVAGVPLVRGRDLGPADRLGAAGAALVNEAFVRTFFPGEDALGRRLEVSTPSAFWGEASPVAFEIVGVVGDVRFLGLHADPEPALYLPFRQFPSWEMRFMVRSDGAPESLIPALREAVWSVNPRQPVADVQRMETVLEASMSEERLQARLVSVFGAVALLLVALALYVLLARSVARRRREIGLRMAIGARPRDVRRQIAGHALRVASLGLLLGSAGALALGHWLEGSLYGVSAAGGTGLAVLAGVLTVLGAVAALACSLPVRRATRIDPAVALREGQA